MALVFPTDPTLGDEFVVGSTTYVYKYDDDGLGNPDSITNKRWDKAPAKDSFVTSDAEPEVKFDGLRWFNTTDATLRVYVERLDDDGATVAYWMAV
jgi:hypothetical protein